jgi:hypothetical protein
VSSAPQAGALAGARELGRHRAALAAQRDAEESRPKTPNDRFMADFIPSALAPRADH